MLNLFAYRRGCIIMYRIDGKQNGAIQMKILAVSDIVESTLYDRFLPEKYPGIDLVVSCGDLPPEYLTFLSSRFEVPLFYVRGNHDIRYAAKPPEGCVNLHGVLQQFGGVNFLGLEGSRWYNGGPAQYTESQMKWIVAGLRIGVWFRGGVDVIITHAPPRHFQDEEDLCHRGFRVYRKLIDRYRPDYFVHGHIHRAFADASERITIMDNTKVVNSYGFFIFQIEGKRKGR